MLLRPSWAAPYSCSVIELILERLSFDIFEACLTRILERLFLWMVVDCSGNGGLSVLARVSYSNVPFFD